MTENNDARKLEIFLKGCFPQLLERLPKERFYLKYGHNEFFSTHDFEIPHEWLNWMGFKKFIAHPDIPDSYFACGVCAHTVAEYLCAFGKKDGRCFWIYDRYVIYVIKDDLSTIPRTREHLKQTLKMWEEEKTDAIFSVGRFVDWNTGRPLE